MHVTLAALRPHPRAPQLGTLSELWVIVKPHVASFELVILSVDQLLGLTSLLGTGVPLTTDSDDDSCLAAMRALHQLWQCKRIALSRKSRDSNGVQLRYSLLSTARAGGGELLSLSTRDRPVQT